MKKIILAVMLSSVVHFSSRAQSAEDIGYEIIFKIIAQIGELKYYSSVLEKGYHIAQQGLHIISDIKNGEFNLHNAFFDSLKRVKPEIREMGIVAEIISIQAKIIVRSKDAMNAIRGSAWLHQEEKDYLLSVFNIIIINSDKNVAALLNYTTNGKLSMNDGERIKMIQQLYNDVKKQYGVLTGYVSDFSKFNYNRKRSFEMGKSLKELYGL